MARVLVIEDEEKLRLVLQKYIEAEGYIAELVADGSHAIEAVRSNKPDIILLDIMLPGKSGIDICKEAVSYTHLTLPTTPYV